MENYQTEVLKTLSGSETYEKHISTHHLIHTKGEYLHYAGQLEIMKKQLAYGKYLQPDLPHDPLNLTPDEVDILHAKLGIAGESGEVIEATSAEEVKKEVGDLLWYVAVLLHKYGLDFPEVMQGNIDKLRERYSTGKFTREEALNRRDMA